MPAPAWMEVFLYWTAVVVGLSVLLSMWRAFRGPTVFDRTAGVGLIGTKTVVILILAGFAYGRVEMFVDISMGYALLGFIGILALARYFEQRGMEAW